jgi:ring-1,2-phenylacetyl-CoA epoxidase subunit PaaC
MTEKTQQPSPEHVEYVLRMGDNALILGQRVSEWCGHAPVLEEDLALANTALDLIGQARMLLTHAGKLEGRGRDEDGLAFQRNEPHFRNLTLCELPNDDFARTIMRNYLFSAFMVLLWERLLQSRDAELAAIAGKSIKEARYHIQHAGEWVLRLGDGTAESHARTQHALDYLWPYTVEIFVDTPIDAVVEAAGVGPAWSTLEQDWMALVAPLLETATLSVPARTPFRSHGKSGRHSEHMGHLLAEMQYMQRAYPGASW